MSDLFGAGGQQLLATTGLAVESRSRFDSLSLCQPDQTLAIMRV
jgi:hypothetical protein